MKHNQYKSWIINDQPLTSKQKQELQSHLETCPQCKKFYLTWLATRQLLNSSRLQVPSPGFSNRWKNYLSIQQEREHARRIRTTLASLMAIGLLANFIYILRNNLILNWIAAGLNGITKLFVILTKGLSNFSQLLNQTPSVPISAGIVFLGILLAFLIVFVFTTWHWLSKEYHADEIIIKN